MVGHIKQESRSFNPGSSDPCSNLGTQDLEGIQFSEGAQEIIVPLLSSMGNTTFLPFIAQTGAEQEESNTKYLILFTLNHWLLGR